MALKLGCSIYSYLWSHSFGEALERVSDLGFKHVEIVSMPPHIWIETPDRRSWSAAHKALDVNRLELASVNPSCASGINLANTNPAVREDSVQRLKTTIEFVHELGGGVLVLPPPVLHSLMPAPFETAWGWVKEGIERCARHAEGYGVTVGLENAAGYRFFTTAGLLQRMVDEVASPCVRMVYDVTNGPESEYPPAALRQIGDCLALIHLSDKSDGNGHLPIGMGQVAFEPIAASLRATGFQGVSVVEVTHPQASDGALLSAAARLEALGWKR